MKAKRMVVLAMLGVVALGCMATTAYGAKELLLFGDPSTDNPAWQEALMERSLRAVSDAFAARGFEVDLIPATNLTARLVHERFAHYTRSLGTNDTFVIYSHGHGYPRGTFFDNWSDFASRVLALPARDVVIFTMSCHSGALTDALQRRRAEWTGRSREGRSLVVLTPAAAEEIAGPSPERTIGNPFTYAITTAAHGAADGMSGTSKNGELEMQELVDHVLKVTHDKSRGRSQTPQFAGEFPTNAVFLRGLGGSAASGR